MADSTPATNASNATRYYNLPLFLSSDRPSWLVDWNGAMNEIDTILNDIAIESEGASGAVATIQTQINTLSTTVENLNSIVETAVADVASMQTTVDSMEDRLDNVESDLITQNNLIKTLSDTVVAMQSTVATLNNHVNVMEQSVTTLGANVEAVQTALTGVQSDVSSLQSSVSSINSSLSSLNTRVTALENAGVSGMPALSDLTFTSTTIPFSNISQTESTVYTASEDCYVIVQAWINESVASAGTGNISERYLTCNVNHVTVCKAYFNFSLSIAGSSSGWDNSGLIKLKAGDTITAVRSIVSGDGNAAIYLNVAPIA